MSGSVPQKQTGEIVIASKGEQYYIIGKTRIKITEHFSSTGKQIDELIADLIASKIKEKVNETA